MDALKKAEQEKREASKKLLSPKDTIVPQNQDEPDHTELQSFPGTNETGELPAESIPADTTYQRSAMDFSLAPLESRPVSRPEPEQADTQAIPVDPSEEPTLNVTLSELSLQKQSTESSTPAFEVEEQTSETGPEHPQTQDPLDPDQTFHGLDIEKAATAGLYEDTIQGDAFKPTDITRSYDETLPGVPAAQLARDIGTQDQPTPVAAQTVFAATQTVARPSSGFRWLLISLCVLAVGSAVVFYYYSVTPVTRDIPSPMVARGVETVTPGQNLVPAEIAAVVEAMDVTGGADPEVIPEADVVSQVDQSSTDEAIDETPAPVQQGIETADEQIAEPAPVVQPIPVVASTPPPLMQAPPSMIRISRSQRPSDQGRLVQEAFTAYQQGDLDLAKTRYEQAYVQFPNNRDVLLGLAAIATKNNDHSRAMQLYTQLVRMNPLDNVARAAILAYQQGEGAPENISTIKSMIYDAPEQPSLHFSLGKLYAAQSRWSEAQQAFFDAYRLDTTNPDYAFNLAVSLDRLGQSASALDYYNSALQLSNNIPAGFNSAAVYERIRTLEARD